MPGRLKDTATCPECKAPVESIEKNQNNSRVGIRFHHVTDGLTRREPHIVTFSRAEYDEWATKNEVHIPDSRFRGNW